jgi:hypothetical protein
MSPGKRRRFPRVRGWDAVVLAVVVVLLVAAVVLSALVVLQMEANRASQVPTVDPIGPADIERMREIALTVSCAHLAHLASVYTPQPQSPADVRRAGMFLPAIQTRQHELGCQR